MTDMEGYDRIHDWRHKLRDVLDDMLKAVENKDQLGYFDALIDIETHANLIGMVLDRYIDNHNGTVDKHDISDSRIKEQFRGGYSIEEQNRIIKLLSNKGELNDSN